MNELLIRELEECKCLCDRAICMSEEDIESYREFLGGELLETYRNASEAASKRLRAIRNELQQLQTAEKNKPLI